MRLDVSAATPPPLLLLSTPPAAPLSTASAPTPTLRRPNALAGYVERRPPVTVTVLGELEIPADAMHALGEFADAAPGVEPAMDELELRGDGTDKDSGEGGAEAPLCRSHHCSRRRSAEANTSESRWRSNGLLMYSKAPRARASSMVAGSMAAAVTMTGTCGRAAARPTRLRALRPRYSRC